MWRSFPLVLLLVTLGSEVTAYWGRSRRATYTVEKPQIQPVIHSLHITSDIKYRYATTLVSTRMVNPSSQSREVTFTVTLPDTAFISEFLMEAKDEVYKAYVKEKEAAQSDYEVAVQAGKSAGRVAVNARDAKQFTVSVNVEALGKVTFNLTYEQLLPRNDGVYCNIININPHQIVEDMSVIVNIQEPTAITYLDVSDFQMSNAAIPAKSNKYAKIQSTSPTHKQVIWKLTPDQQKSINIHGVSGQFIVKYDVDREGNYQQILLDEGYFVHFFAPEGLPNIKKHVVFVLDFSSSMRGRKLRQLKEAMTQIFSDLGPDDYFSIVIFQSYVEVWSPRGTYTTGRRVHRKRWKTWTHGVLDSKFVMKATPNHIRQARSFMENYYHLGSTNIMGGLRTGLELVDIGEKQWKNENEPCEPILVFLTDGEPNVEESNTNVIIYKTKELNKNECPIYSLAFGYSADFSFLRKLSLQNFGFARKIYEAADATQQLKKFYKTISSPLLSEITFSYLPGQVDSSSNTQQQFPVFFKGSELVVAGKVNTKNIAEGKRIGDLRGTTANGSRTYPVISDRVMSPQTSSDGHLEKVWSFLTIRQLLDKADSLDSGLEQNQTRKEALDLALKYGFVTPLTSLVVVNPNGGESFVDPAQVFPGAEESCTDPRECPGLADELDVRFGPPGPENRTCYEVTQPPPLEENQNVSSDNRFGGPPPPPSSRPPTTTQSSNSGFDGLVFPSDGSTETLGADNRFGDPPPPSPPPTTTQSRNSGFDGLVFPNDDSSETLVAGNRFGSPSPPPSPTPPTTTQNSNSGFDGLVFPSDGSAEVLPTAPQIEEDPRPQKISLKDVKWIQGALNTTDVNTKCLRIAGNDYKLGINETNANFGDCIANGDSGECHHFQYCALDVFQDDVSKLLPFECDITGSFLGVCCPKYLV